MSPGVDARVARAAGLATQQAMLHRQMSGVSPVLPLVAGYGAVNAFQQPFTQRMPAAMPYGYPALGAASLVGGPSVLAEMSLTGLMPFSNVMTHNKHHVAQVPKVKKHSLIGNLAETNLKWSDDMKRTRLVGYLNEAAWALAAYVGEPAARAADKIVDGFSWLYAGSKAIKAYEEAPETDSQKLKLTRGASALAYGYAFQWMASLQGPVWFVKQIKNIIGHVAKPLAKSEKHLQAMQAIGAVISIPFLVKPIDWGARFILDHTLKPVTDSVINIMAKAEQNNNLSKQQAPAYRAMAAAPRFESFA